MYFEQPAYIMNPLLVDVLELCQFIGPPLDNSVKSVAPVVFPRIHLNGATYEPLPLVPLGSHIMLDKDHPEFLDFQKEINSSCATFIRFYTAFQMTSSKNCIPGWTEKCLEWFHSSMTCFFWVLSCNCISDDNLLRNMIELLHWKMHVRINGSSEPGFRNNHCA